MQTHMTAGRLDHATGTIRPWGEPKEPIDPVEAVREFITKFDMGHDPELWVTLVREEYAELSEAMSDTTTESGAVYYANVLKEAADLIYVMTGVFVIDGYLPENVFQAAQGLLKSVRAVVGNDALVEAFEAVHTSNLSKLDDDGKPVRRADGKIMKGPNYRAPDLTVLGAQVFRRLNLDVSGVNR